MLRTRSGLPRFAVRWVAQVAASVGATVAASLIYTALPKPGPFAVPTSPALTSGGKFAARAVVPVAYDGLDAMPLPHVTPLPVRLAEVAPAALHAEGDAQPFAAAATHRAPRATRVVPKAEARRSAEPPPHGAPAVLVTAVAPADAARADGERSDDGFMPAVLPRVVSTARAAWTLTASASESLVARIVPQIP